jgi:hypothetical protein
MEITVTDNKLIRRFNPESGCFSHVGRDGQEKAVLKAQCIVIGSMHGPVWNINDLGHVRLIDPLTKAFVEIVTQVIVTESSRIICGVGVFKKGLAFLCLNGVVLAQTAFECPVAPTIEEKAQIVVNASAWKEKEANFKKQEQEKQEAILAVFEELKSLPKLPQILEESINKGNRDKFFGERARKAIFRFAKNIKDDWQHDTISFLWTHKEDLISPTCD